VKDTAHYIKIVEWSEEDKCYIGSSPGLFYGGCHGEDEQAVFRELCQIVEETIADMRANEQPLPPATTWRSLVSRQDVA
jgi:predicted RNase H-like HicB family nuclease